MAHRVFISGSRSFKYQPDNFTKLMDLLMQNDDQILVGDSEKGVDNTALTYLGQNNYPNVRIGGTRSQPRSLAGRNGINHNHWNYQQTLTDYNLRPGEKETLKDIALGDQATAAIGVVQPYNYYNRLSRGTLRNMVQVTQQQKPAWLLYVQDNKLKAKQLNEPKDLDNIIASYNDPNMTRQFNQLKNTEIKRLNSQNKNHAKQNDGPDF